MTQQTDTDSKTQLHTDTHSLRSPVTQTETDTSLSFVDVRLIAYNKNPDNNNT